MACRPEVVVVVEERREDSGAMSSSPVDMDITHLLEGEGEGQGPDGPLLTSLALCTREKGGDGVKLTPVGH